MLEIISFKQIGSQYGGSSKGTGGQYVICFSENGMEKTISLYLWLCEEETMKGILEHKEFFRNLIRIDVEKFGQLQRFKNIYMDNKKESIIRRLEKINNDNR
jgi:hypothetical protein